MWQSRRTICFLTMTSTEHRIQAEAETRSPEGLQQRSKASAGSGGRNGLLSIVIMCVSTCVRAATSPEPEPRGSQVLRLAASRGGLPSAAPGSIKEGGGRTKCCAWQHQGGGGGPETRSGTVPEVLPLPAETSREAPKCCAWQHQGRGGARNPLGYRPSLKCCPCQQKRAARVPSAAPGSMKRGGPETRSGTVQTLKCCPCQQKRAASIKERPRNALGHCLDPEVLPLPAETSREAPKCCAWQHQNRGPETRSGTVQSLSVGFASRNEPRGSQVLRLAASRGGAPKRARAPSRA